MTQPTDPIESTISTVERTIPTIESALVLVERALSPIESALVLVERALPPIQSAAGARLPAGYVGGMRTVLITLRAA